MAERIFDEKTLRKLDQLTIIVNKVRAGAIKGERRSSRRGTSIEFADYRNYVRGDDLRRVDWNIYARLQRPFIKLLEDEEDLAVYLVLDASASMDWPRSGERDHHKFLYARRVLAGLGYWAVAARGVRIRKWMLAILMALILPGLYEGFAVAHAVLCLTMGQVEAGVPKPPYWDAILVSLLAVLLLTSAASFGGRVPRDRSVSSL